MKISFYTLGCKVNYYETGVMREAFEARGAEVVPFGTSCDVAVVHSCAVTAESARKSGQALRKIKRKNPDTLAVFVGCAAQELRDSSDADLVIGNADKKQIVPLVYACLEERKHTVHLRDMSRVTEFEPMTLHEDERTRAYVKIEDGCNNFCTYCIIPYLRGRVRSKPLADAVSEIRGLVANGYAEIVLTGIHLDSYRDGEATLCDLLEAVDRIDGLVRVRLGSLEPVFITDENLARMAKLRCLCPHFHLSLQSGCDRTLKRMNRHYTASEFAQAAEKLRKTFPQVSLTTDVIVGFPDEMEEDFVASLEFVRKIGFAKVHVFPYSPREGTRAAGMEHQIDAETKKERTARMMACAADGESAFLQSLVGKETDVLFETCKNGIWTGSDVLYSEIRVPASEDLQGKIRRVRLTESCGTYLKGELFETST